MKHLSQQITNEREVPVQGLAFLNFVITPRFGVCPSYALWRGQRRWGANVLRLLCRVRFQDAVGSTGYSRRWSYRSSDKGGEQRACSPTISENRSKVVRFCTTFNEICLDKRKKQLFAQTVVRNFIAYAHDMAVAF